MNDLFNTPCSIKRIDSCSLYNFSKRKSTTDILELAANAEFPFHYSKKRRTKSVRFDSSQNEIQLLKRTEQELSNAWLSREEYKDIRNSNRETIVALKDTSGRLSDLDTDRFCLRGLETHIAYYIFNDKRSRHRELTRQILMEQQKQKHIYGAASSNMLKILSLTYSKDAKSQALKMASLDAQERHVS